MLTITHDTCRVRLMHIIRHGGMFFKRCREQTCSHICYHGNAFRQIANESCAPCAAHAGLWHVPAMCHHVPLVKRSFLCYTFSTLKGKPS